MHLRRLCCICLAPQLRYGPGSLERGQQAAPGSAEQSSGFLGSRLALQCHSSADAAYLAACCNAASRNLAPIYNDRSACSVAARESRLKRATSDKPYPASVVRVYQLLGIRNILSERRAAFELWRSEHFCRDEPTNAVLRTALHGSARCLTTVQIRLLAPRLTTPYTDIKLQSVNADPSLKIKCGLRR